MKIKFLWLLVFILLYLGKNILASYDYSATTECLEEPWKAQYDGGIIQNSGFNDGVEGWTTFGQGKIEQRSTDNGYKFIVVFNRTQPTDCMSQRVHLEKGKFYAFSAWFQINEGSEMIAVVFKDPNGERLHGGTVIAQQGCWSMLKGGIFANFSGPADLTFESQTAATEIWADNVSLKPFTKKEWRSHQDMNIAKVRRRKVKFYVTNGNKSVSGAEISIKQTNSEFPIGCEINLNILNNTGYQNWFTSRFTVTAFGNEMKWYSNEKTRGKEDYTISDAMLQFCEQNNISVRGHNVLWDDPRYQPTWLNNINNPKELRKLAEKRTKSVVSRYKGRLIAWDVVNENLHFRYYEDKLGDEDASAEFYAMTYELDQRPMLFLNEYNTIELSQDEYSIPAKYARKLKNILSYQARRNDSISLPMGVGLQSRFGPGQPNLAYMRAGMDYLASLGYPLWLTEVFIDKGENQEEYIEEVLREGYSHPSVEGIVIWPTSPFGSECKMCLVDKDFKNTPNGDVVDKLITELWKAKPVEMASNSEGYSQVELIHGDYQVIVRHPKNKFITKLMLKVNDSSTNIVHVHLDNPFVPYANM